MIARVARAAAGGQLLERWRRGRRIAQRARRVSGRVRGPKARVRCELRSRGTLTAAEHGEDLVVGRVDEVRRLLDPPLGGEPFPRREDRVTRDLPRYLGTR